MPKDGIDQKPTDVRVQDLKTKQVRYINKKSYELNSKKYRLLGKDEKTEDEIREAERAELAKLRQEIADLKAAKEPASEDEDEQDDQSETDAGEQSEATVTRKKPGPKPKNVQPAE